MFAKDFPKSQKIPGRNLGRVKPKATFDHGKFKAVVSGKDGKVRFFPRMKFHYDAAKDVDQSPPTVDWTTATGAAKVIGQMYLNDQEGDCVIASREHGEGIAAANAGGTVHIASDTETDQNYQEACGPGDNGCDMGTVNQYRQTTGLMMAGSRRKSLGAASVDNTNQALVEVLIGLGFNLNIGFDLPNKWYQSDPSVPWDVVTGADAQIVGGHEVQGAGYTRQASVVGFTAAGVKILTWGGVRTMTWAAFTSTQWIDELYAELTPAVVSSSGLAASGIDLVTLQADLAIAASGKIPPLPLPVPVPPGPPVPPSPPVPPTPVPVEMTGYTTPQTVTVHVPLGHGTMNIQIPALPVTVTASPAGSKVTPKQWAEISEALASDRDAGTTADHVREEIGTAHTGTSFKTKAGVYIQETKKSLSPAQWAAIIQAILTLLPIIFGGSPTPAPVVR